MEFVTVKSSHYVNDLFVAKSVLESQEIYCHIKNEYSTHILDHMGTFVAELQVRNQDYEKAMNILDYNIEDDKDNSEKE
jgi:hypothetical protein